MHSSADIDLTRGVQYGVSSYLVVLGLTIVAVELKTPVHLAGLASLDFEGYLLSQLYIHEVGVVSRFAFAVELLFWTALSAGVLTAAGYYLSRRADGGATQGAAIGLGYFVAAAVAVAFIYTQATPRLGDMLVQLVVAGVVVPAVFGALGGYVASRRSDRVESRAAA